MLGLYSISDCFDDDGDDDDNDENGDDDEVIVSTFFIVKRLNVRLLLQREQRQENHVAVYTSKQEFISFRFGTFAHELVHSLSEW